jgi:hypothetical protein
VDNCQFYSDFRVYLISQPSTQLSEWIGCKRLAQCRFIGSTSGFQFLTIGSGQCYKGSMQLFSIEAECSSLGSVPPLHPQIQHLVDSFATLFEPPTSLPLYRSCNHSIPLLPRAQPVFVRPYRYPPNLKDEYEKQVKEMLD